jgi:hypothetical protein
MRDTALRHTEPLADYLTGKNLTLETLMIIS